MTLVHDAGELRRGARPGLPLRHGRAGRGVPRRRPRPRGLDHRQRPGPPRAVRPGRDRVRPRVLRLRREVHARPVRDDRPAPRCPTATAPRPAQDRARRLPGDRRRGLRPGRLPARRRRRSTCPRSTRSRASPRSASSRRCRPRAATRSPPSAPGSSTWRSSATPPRAGRRLTTGGPAAMNGRPLARRTRTPVPTRRTRPVRRASAGLSTRPGRRRAGDARLGGRRSTASAPRPAFDYTTAPARRASSSPTRPASRRALAAARGENLFRLSDRAARRRRSRRCRPSTTRRVDVRLPGDAGGHHRGARAGPRLAGRRARATSPTPTATLFARLGRRRRRRRRPACPVVDDRRAASAGLVGRVAARPGRPRRGDPARLARARPTSAARRSRWPSRSPTRTASSSEPEPAGWSAVFGFYTPSLRTTELIPGQVRLLRSLLDGREPQVDRVILASDTDGTYIAASRRPSRRAPSPAPSTEAP